MNRNIQKNNHDYRFLETSGPVRLIPCSQTISPILSFKKFGISELITIFAG